MSALLLVALVALGGAIVLGGVAVATGRSGRSGVVGAIAAIEHQYSHMPHAAAGPTRHSLESTPDWVRTVAVRLSPSGIEAKLQRRLDLAGNPRSWTPDRILAVKGVSLFALTGVGALLGAPRGVGILIVAIAVGAVVGFFLPDILLINAGQKRQTKIRKALPDALDMLTVCVEAGLGFDAALAQVARNTSGPLALELARVLQEMQLGSSRTHALKAMTDRTTVPELRTFVSALVQASELGVPIARVLREQAKAMRVRRRQRAEEQAQKVPVKILFPLVVCLFPALFVVILGPGALSIMKALF